MLVMPNGHFGQAYTILLILNLETICMLLPGLLISHRLVNQRSDSAARVPQPPCIYRPPGGVAGKEGR